MASIDRHADFGAAVEGSLPNPCTPRLDAEGIAINLPESVTLTGDARDFRLLLCGAYSLPYDHLGLRGEFRDQLLVAAIDGRHQVFANRYQPWADVSETRAEAPPRPAGISVASYDAHGNPIGAPQLVSPTVGGAFTTDLVPLLRLPAVAAEYLVYVVLGPVRSNVLRVKVNGAPP